MPVAFLMYKKHLKINFNDFMINNMILRKRNIR
jgi:hypothetical protein